MGQLGTTFRGAVATAVRSPIHLAVVVAVGFVATLAALVIPFVPVVGLVASPVITAVLLAPLVVAALLGSAQAARNGDSAYDGARTAVVENGPDLVGAYGLVALSCLLGGGAVGAVVVLGAAGVGWLAEPRTLLTGLNAVVVSLPLLVTVSLGLLATLALQFAAPAAVVAGTGPVDSLRAALRFVAANPLGVVGFSLLAVAVGAVASIPGIALAAAVWSIDATVAAAVILVIGYVEAAAVSGAVVSVFLVAYFEAAADEAVLPAGYRLGAVEETGAFEFGSERLGERR